MRHGSSPPLLLPLPLALSLALAGAPPEVLDEGLYFDVPPAEVAYNVQIVRLEAGGYATVYHGEPLKPPGLPGDAVKAALQPGPFAFAMPAERRFAIASETEDRSSPLYSVGALWGGAGNPVVIRGRGEAPHVHVFFLVLTDDSGDRAGRDFRHQLCHARTRDFHSFDLRVETEGRIEWRPLRPDTPATHRRPWLLRDRDGARIAGRCATEFPDTQGLIGSMFVHGGVYHFCYTDRDADRRTRLFMRTCTDPDRFDDDRTGWSPAVPLSGELPTGTLIRVAPARGKSRWTVLYNGYSEGPRGLRQGLFLQYTDEPSAEGPRGLAGLRWFDRIIGGHGVGPAHAQLDLRSGGGIYAQHDLLTDEEGALAVPETDDARPEVEGLLTWADFTRGVAGGQVFRARWRLPGQATKAD